MIKACHGLGLQAIGVFSQADAGALHVSLCDAAYAVGPAKPQESYLNIDAILSAAHQSGADAIHPGYGFLAENADFARQVEAADLIWIGPGAATIEDMGDKEHARQIAMDAGISVLPGSPRFGDGELDGLSDAAEQIGYPLLIKTAAGGGGIGMRRVDAAKDLKPLAQATQAMAARVFGDGAIYLERLVPRARHIEVQIFGLGDGRAVHLNERECSIQRRYQKIIEESPAPGLTAAMRKAMTEAALRLAAQQCYRGAGTVEFILDEEKQTFYFLEMNTRIQVEHPVTEMVTGEDLVNLQIRLAWGERLEKLTQDRIQPSGHAIECRLYAENPQKMFLPSPGTISQLTFPTPLEGVRIDCGAREGDEITIHYDPMIAKVICHGRDRGKAIAKSIATLKEIRLEGLETNLLFLIRTLTHSAFATGNTHTGFIDEHQADLLGN